MAGKANTRGQAVPAAQVPLWMATFADMMALMMCFFTLLFAMSKTEEEKLKAVAGSLRAALSGVQMISRSQTPSPTPSMMPSPSAGSPSIPTIKLPRPAVQAMQRLQERLQGELRAGNLQLRRGPKADQLIISLPEHVAFASGSARLRPQAKALIDKLMVQLDPSVRQLTVAGHSDSIPLRNSRYYSSNWDLSASRAVAVAEHVLASGAVRAGSLSIRGYADTQPVAPNDTPENRARNRRVEWLLDFAPPEDTAEAQTKPLAEAPSQTLSETAAATTPPQTDPSLAPRIQLPAIPAVLEKPQTLPTTSAEFGSHPAAPAASRTNRATGKGATSENAQRLIQALRDGGLVQQ